MPEYPAGPAGPGGAVTTAVTVTVGPIGSNAQFICTGLHDGAVLQAAVNSLPAAGGRVLIRNSATPYDFSSKTDRIFTTASNIILEGETYGGVVFKANASLFPGGSTAQGKYGILTVGKTQTALQSNVIIRNLILDCNNQLKTGGLHLDGGSAMLGHMGLQNVWLEYVTVKNQCEDLTSDIESGCTISSGTDNALGNRGLVDKVTFWRCDFGPSNNAGMWIQGTGVTNLRWIECQIHDCQSNGINIFDYGTSVSHSDWCVERCRFERNMITTQSYSQAHFRDTTQRGVNNFEFINNYVGPMVNQSTTQDYALTPYCAANNRISGNIFDQSGNGISLGRSSSGSQSRFLPLNRLLITDNVFVGLRACFDSDAAVFAKISGNVFYGILTGPVISPYSDHWPTVIEDNIFYDCNVNDSAGGSSNSRSFIRLTGNGFTVRNNHFIDDRVLPDPSEAAALTSTAGGALGSRTYYVRYTWSNATGETLAHAEQSIALTANHLLTINAGTSGPASSVPPGATHINYYVSAATGTETLQASVAIPALSFAWTEPASGLVAGAALPGANTTAAQTAFGIYEEAGGGANSEFANVYEGNQFFGIPSGSEIVLNSAYTRISRGNTTNPSLANAGATLLDTVRAPASATSAASLNIPTGAAPTSPNTGDVYSDGTHLYIYLAASWKTVV